MLRLGSGRPRVWLATLAVVAGALSTSSCGREPTAGANPGVASFALPFANQTSGSGDDVSNVSLTLYAINPSAPSQSDRKKELRSYRFSRTGNTWSPKGVNDPNDDTSPVTITIDFPIIEGTTYQIEGTASNSAGVSLFSIEPATFTDKQASGSAGSVTVQTTITYIGPGSNASSITVAPSSVSLSPGQTGSFSATVKDAAGNTINNAPVRWRSSNGAIAFFQNDAVGTVTAGNTVGTTTVTAGIEGLSVTGSAQVTVGLTPTSVALVSGGGQSAQVGTQLANPIIVRVLAGTVPVPGRTVNFTVASGSLSAASAVTDASGQAQVRWTLGPTAGSQTLTVASAGVSNLAVTATATAIPQTVSFVSLTPSALTPGGTSTVLVQVRNANNVAVSGETVTFSHSAGSLSAPTATTNASGQASVVFTAPSSPGTYSITAAVTGSSAVTTIVVANNQTSVASQMVKISGDGQQIRAGQTSASPIVVEVRNASGAPVSGAFVDFFGNSGASRIVTGSDGRASASLSVIPGAQTGTFSVVVQLFPNTSISVSFSYTVIP